MPSILKFSKCPPWPWLEDLRRLDRADRGELQRLQWEKFCSLIEYAQLQVDYYKEGFAQAGIRAADLVKWEDLLLIPTISKQQIAANFPDRITARASNCATWQFFATSGTTDRLMVIKDAEALSRNMALSLYEEEIQGTYAPGSLLVNIPPDACSLACAVASRRPKSAIGRMKQSIRDLVARNPNSLPRWFAGQAMRAIASPAREMPSFGPEGTRVSPELLDWYLDRIQLWHPNVLSGLPTYLQLLARRHYKGGGKSPLKIGSLLPQGALSTPSLRNELMRAFQVPVHEVYGGHEFGCVASTCERQDKMHIMMAECLVECVRNGRHVASGELGEIVVTPFTNKIMPLIRYRPGDVGRFYEDYCACGRQTQLLVVEGRLEDTVVTSKGIRTEQEIIDFVMAWPNIEFFQLVQRDERWCDLLVVEKEKNQVNLCDLADITAEFLGNDLQIRPRLVSTIKPEVSGKFRFVKSTSHRHFHEGKLERAPVLSPGSFQMTEKTSLY